MNTQRGKSPHSPALWIDEVVDDIAYFRRCIDEAGPVDCEARRAAQAAYSPFLARRFELLAELTANSDVDDEYDDDET